MNTKLDISETIWIASVAFEKGYDFGELNDSDYMYGHESETEDVWRFVNEIKNIGRIAFEQKYSNHKLYF